MKVIVLKQSLHRQPFQSSPVLHTLVSSRTRSYHLKSSFSSKQSLPDRFQQIQRARSSKSNELNRSIAAQVPIATTNHSPAARFQWTSRKPDSGASLPRQSPTPDSCNNSPMFGLSEGLHSCSGRVQNEESESSVDAGTML
jgi:hypothetical protein